MNNEVKDSKIIRIKLKMTMMTAIKLGIGLSIGFFIVFVIIKAISLIALVAASFIIGNIPLPDDLPEKFNVIYHISSLLNL